jgi:hypothetical protein
LNQRLPAGYFAEPNAQFGIEIDAAAYGEVKPAQASEASNALSNWEPRSPTATLPFQPTTDVVEVQVFSLYAGPTLVGAIEIVSPANKDRPVHWDTLSSKCQTYLQQGIGLILVDVVTNPTANLHNALMRRLDLLSEPFQAVLYAVAYRVADLENAPHLDIWQKALSLSNPLPTLPLYLKGGLCIPVDLDQTYQLTYDRQRIPGSSSQ